VKKTLRKERSSARKDIRLLDDMKELTHLSLFSGIGGLDLAAEWAGFESVGQCEFADYPTKVLEKHWPDVPRWRDIRTLTGEDFYARTGRRTIDVISGGFPCQPFSVAGKQRGKEDDRFLWPEMVRVIKELRPTWVVGENVAGIVNLALDDVLSDLEAEGYETRTFLIPACGVGAPHQRYRTAIVGYSEHNGSSAAEISRILEETGGRLQEGANEPGQPTGTSKPGYMQSVARNANSGNRYEGKKQSMEKRENSEPAGIRTDVADSTSKGERGLSIQSGESRQTDTDFVRRGEDVADSKSNTQGRLPGRAEKEKPGLAGGGEDAKFPDRPGCKEQHFTAITGRWWSIEPDVGRVANGIPFRVDRLRCLGNAVVPQQFYPVFRAIADIEIISMLPEGIKSIEEYNEIVREAFDTAAKIPGIGE